MKLFVIKINGFLFVLLSSILIQAYGQQTPDYFDFWKDGTWKSEISIYNQDTITEKDQFVVQKLKGKIAFKEQWKIFIGDDQYVNAEVLRAFDQETKKWKLFYVDDINAQSWDSQMANNIVFFHKEFTYKGKTFYSRQAWSLRQDGSVLRTIERSDDNKTWKPRYWQLFTRKK